MQGAAFEKNSRPDAGAVVDGEPLDVEDDPSRRPVRFLLLRTSHGMARFAYEINILQFMSNCNISHICMDVKSLSPSQVMVFYFIIC